MSATSGIGVSQELTDTFASAVDSQSVRFLKISIQNESLVVDHTVPVSGTLEQDLDNLKDILQEKIPAYVLVRLDEPPSDWLAVYYVPDAAQVRDKMLYAATRASLTKSLGSTHFTSTLFATSLSDLTPAAYRAHLAHLSAPQPMSAREKEMEEVKKAEREADVYRGSSVRTGHSELGKLGFEWGEGVEAALKGLGEGDGTGLVVLSVDTTKESLVLKSSQECTISQLGSALPPSEPCYAFLAWPHSYTSPPRREIVFIYSCPSTSPIKHRMIYSSGALIFYNQVKAILAPPNLSPSTVLASRKIETSNPRELDEEHVKSELGLEGSGVATPVEAGSGAGGNGAGEEKKAFARPKGPGRRR
ncbi:hypothetical protein JAAARDRAFT_31659 [Jaapia argillacea MUCL 33604]|uniref:ADF-H domain-containing protein n=1 Tax=Jaapia argillacea MUCL 33604 TaxID=933084 RepID=A0A067Q3D7_9AGAM|nr:hypothetical protein JAAARDRAFT_31659 [Jaapia argillacea MUCL 33604]